MSAPINNITDLRNEIERLKISKAEQEEVIKQHFSSPSAVMGTLVSALSPGRDKSSFFKVDDIITMVSRFVLPMVLNKTIFRSSNFVVKTVVGVLSQSASGLINEKTLSAAWGTLKNIIPDAWTKKGKKPVDYGIPPLSETY